MRIPDIDRGVKVRLADGSERPLVQFLIPTALLTLAALLLIASMLVPYWQMTLYAPQFPDGLHVDLYVDHIEGDVQEIDGLNHYLGLPPLEDAGKLERKVAFPSLIVFAGLLVAAGFVHNRLAIALAVPTLAFPFAFLADLKYILYDFGHSIKPDSALGGAIDPFSPPLFGWGVIGQFKSYAWAGPGLWLVAAAVVVTIIGLWFHHVAYAPIAAAHRAEKASKKAQRGAVKVPKKGQPALATRARHALGTCGCCTPTEDTQ